MHCAGATHGTLRKCTAFALRESINSSDQAAGVRFGKVEWQLKRGRVGRSITMEFDLPSHHYHRAYPPMSSHIPLQVRRRFSAMLLLAIPLTTLAQSPSPYPAPPLVVPQIQIGKPIAVTYRCAGGQSFKATYWNGSNGQSFALLPVQGRPMFLVSGMSADGVRYQAGFVTWWSKGRGGDLYDARVSTDKPVLRGCQSK